MIWGYKPPDSSWAFNQVFWWQFQSVKLKPPIHNTRKCLQLTPTSCQENVSATASMPQWRSKNLIKHTHKEKTCRKFNSSTMFNPPATCRTPAHVCSVSIHMLSRLPMCTWKIHLIVTEAAIRGQRPVPRHQGCFAAGNIHGDLRRPCNWWETRTGSPESS